MFEQTTLSLAIIEDQYMVLCVCVGSLFEDRSLASKRFVINCIPV